LGADASGAELPSPTQVGEGAGVRARRPAALTSALSRKREGESAVPCKRSFSIQAKDIRRAYDARKGDNLLQVDSQRESVLDSTLVG